MQILHQIDGRDGIEHLKISHGKIVIVNLKKKTTDNATYTNIYEGY